MSTYYKRYYMGNPGAFKILEIPNKPNLAWIRLYTSPTWHDVPSIDEHIISIKLTREEVDKIIFLEKL